MILVIASTWAAEIFNPATGHFVAGPPMSERRRSHTTTMLKSGAILVTGGECYQEINGHLGAMPWRTAELGQNIR